eukprot:TRINITY_DN4516_c1_g3_i1.p1 TRINITY_DN4516_c1_g3~~TRINITY_DN4516_c1_g3_i1.p1  ORF type:complete len:625 (-),score=204.92 TRINITY_DN4516_c1_g3_i1:1558-3396(-)
MQKSIIFVVILLVCGVFGSVVDQLNYYANQAHSEATNGFERKIDGKLGHAYNSITGSIGLPVAEFSYGGNWNGYQIPTHVSNAGVSKIYSSQDVMNGFTDARNVRNRGFGSGWIFNNGIYTADMNQLKTQYFNAEDLLAVSTVTYAPLSWCVSSFGSLKMNRWASLALSILPNNYHSWLEKEAYKTFVKHWGTNVVKCTQLGGQLQQIDQFDYLYNRAGVAGQSSAKFTRDSKINFANGAAVNSAAAIDATYDKSSHSVFWAYGGNPELAGRKDYHGWMNSVNSNLAPVAIEIAPFSQVVSGSKGSNIEKAINDLVSETTRSWNSINTCPHCTYGTCQNGQQQCSCPSNAYGRTCQFCQTGWAGANCATPHCSSCNAAGGACIAPNTCRCNRCYGGANCASYTCGCMDGEGVLQLANNGTVTAKEVQIGDEVLALNAEGELIYSPVFYVRERDIGEDVGLLKVSTKSRSTVVTVDHLLFTADSSIAAYADRTAIMTEDLKEGDLLWVEVDGQMIAEPIESIESKPTRSMMAVQTMEGNVILDGVAVSSYETNETWGWIESLEERFMFKYFPSIAKSDGYRAVSNYWEDYLQIPIVDTIYNSYRSVFPKEKTN